MTGPIKDDDLAAVKLVATEGIIRLSTVAAIIARLESAEAALKPLCNYGTPRAIISRDSEAARKHFESVEAPEPGRAR